MLAIRMQRNGRTHLPVYRIVVQESQRHPLSGRVVAEVGSYNPNTKALTMDKAAVEKYLSNGAQPSSRVAFILKKNGIKLPNGTKKPPRRIKPPNTLTNSGKTNQKKEPQPKPQPKKQQQQKHKNSPIRGYFYCSVCMFFLNLSTSGPNFCRNFFTPSLAASVCASCFECPSPEENSSPFIYIPTAKCLS